MDRTPRVLGGLRERERERTEKKRERTQRKREKTQRKREDSVRGLSER